MAQVEWEWLQKSHPSGLVEVPRLWRPHPLPKEKVGLLARQPSAETPPRS